MPSSVIGSIGSTLASKAIGSLFGGGSSSSFSSNGGVGPGFVPFSAGGLDLRISPKGVLTVGQSTSSKETNPRTIAINNLIDSYGKQALGLRNTIPDINAFYDAAINPLSANIEGLKPGFGQVTDARVNTIQNAGKRAESDLRGNLARRRVLGSSFANDDISRTRAEFAQQEANARAQSYLEELDAQTRLIGQRLAAQVDKYNTVSNVVSQAFSYDRAADQTQLDELNKHVDIVTRILGGVMNMAQNNAAAERNAALQAGQAYGGLASNIASSASPYLNVLGSKLSGYGNYLYNSLFGSGTQSFGDGTTIAWN